MKTNKSIRKRSCLIALALILGLTLVGGTLAYLYDRTKPVVNTFTPSKVDTEIKEDLEGNVKKNVKIENTSDIDAYIRADIVVTWQDEAGNVLGEKPALGTDYTMTQTSTDWKEIKGLYYYTKKVSPNAPDNFTTNLIDSCTPKVTAPVKGYTLHVEILAEAIQAEPDTAIIDAWGVNPHTDLGVK